MRRLEEVVFWKEYVATCRGYGHEVTKALRGQVGKATLDLRKAETLTLDDWKPLLSTLAKDTSLHYIAFSASSTRYKVLEGLVMERDVRGASRRTPPLYSRHVMANLATSLSDSLAASKSLTSLLLSKIPIKDIYLETLCQGLGKTRSLQHLALVHCPIEDNGVTRLCQALASRPTLTTLDLTDCGLTHASADHIANLIKKQCCVRVSEVWKGCLRYGSPADDDMPGLRRITLNLNPGLGDKGTAIICSALHDDLWIKGIDMQGCGVSEEGAREVAELLDVNSCLTVFDLRGNVEAAPALPALMTRLRANLASSKPGPFKCRWLEEAPLPSGRVSEMTLQVTAPPSRASTRGSDTSVASVKSNASEPAWSYRPVQRPPLRKKIGVGLVCKAQSLEGGVDKLRAKSTVRDDHCTQPIMEMHEKIPEDLPATEPEIRKPLLSVSNSQYDALKNFKTLTQSLIQARKAREAGQTIISRTAEQTEGDDSTMQQVEGLRPQTRQIELGAGDSMLHTKQGKEGFVHPSHLGAGDCAPSALHNLLPKPLQKTTLEVDKEKGTNKEDYYREKARLILKRLAKLGQEKEQEGVGVVKSSSQALLPTEHRSTVGSLQASSSFHNLPTLRPS